MPKVITPSGDKHFSYSRAGRAAAKAYARKNDYDLVESKDGSYKAKKRKKGEPHGRY
jgi:hypothetical protein